jgi:hypothetical protein
MEKTKTISANSKQLENLFAGVHIRFEEYGPGKVYKKGSSTIQVRDGTTSMVIASFKKHNLKTITARSCIYQTLKNYAKL